ncbi:integrase [Paramagnetospirillum kuznetsovii]|uniref:Integrase n=1 Tax=Paramagnetospirillum kuznetsovii TaxID=2053833 RepID=A0A364NVM3_9PROT|nr:tyrosine-type recombinase/integrase [Paramagnetospirillum kuznetsovii]RAU21103.1 integrase [Paramagnetospirillum kuznetsovii]
MTKIVKKRLADGTIKEYRYGDDTGVRTVGAVIREYQRSTAFQRASQSTKRQRIRYMYNIMKAYQDSDITKIKRRHALMSMDTFADRPGAANAILQCWRVLMNFAVDREYIEFNPITRIKPMELSEHRRWTDAEIAFAMKTLPEAMSRAIVLALWTGQREGDCIAMRWSDYDGTGIKIVQQKTGEKLYIPCPAALKAELDAWPKVALTILTNASGRPFNVKSFQSYFSRLMHDHVELTGCVFHGLRKTAAAKLAEAGCSSHEIMSITGHRTLAMVEHYAREADQKTRANSAILKLETSFQKASRNLMK